MPFKAVSKEDANKALPRISVNIQLVGDLATEFKKEMIRADISGKDLAYQMVTYCLREVIDAAAGKAKA